MKFSAAGCLSRSLRACFALPCILLSCGLEDFPLIEQIPENSVSVTLTDRARISLPSGGREGYGTYFDHFVIFYRIYSSAALETSIVDTDVKRSAINPTLQTDFSNLFSYTDFANQSASTSNLDNTFLNRSYFALDIEGEGIDRVLGRSALGATLEISFPPNSGVPPTLAVDGGSPHLLRRAIMAPGKTFYIKPDAIALYRSFLNHPELYDNLNATAQVNADVAGLSGQQPQYTYVSMYIAALGKSTDVPPRDVFSRPTFIGVFRLADSN